MNIYDTLKNLPLFFALVSCAGLSYTETSSRELPLTKQKQRIAFLQKKLEMAEKEKKKVEAEVEHLSEEITQAKLAVITQLVNTFEEEMRRNPKKWSGQGAHLFLKERESLCEMIQSGSYSFEAQMVLDKILQMITELSDA
jgi:anti-sigma28 factor (negative regulator of flagellin synthesis)